jgi:predicted nucleic acid-binding protein
LIVVDASVLVHALGEDEHSGTLARQRLRGQTLLAPELIDLEVVSAWRRHLAQGNMSSRRAQRALTQLAELPLRRMSHRWLLPRCWELRENVTPYDAAYVALAELFGVPLLTADIALTRAPGLRCPIEVVM